MSQARSHLAVALTLAAGAACAPAADERKDASASDTTNRLAESARCFRTTESMLARRPRTVVEGPADLTGWIRLDGLPVRDSGAARLVDSDGTSIGASWRRVASDSIAVTAFNDFLRVDVRLAVADSTAAGVARAHSDAALERDSAGRRVEFRREWSVSARRASCDSVPAPGNG